MIITTTENIPGKKYEIIEICVANRLVSILSKTEAHKAIEKLKETAKEMKADAVVAIKPYTTGTSSVVFVGTAVRFID